MHEISLCQTMIRILDEILAGKEIESVNQVELIIGPLSGVEVKLLNSAFKAVVIRTRYENAKLIINETDVKIHCNVCNVEVRVELNDLMCPVCNSHDIKLVSGNEFLIKNVKVREIQRNKGG